MTREGKGTAVSKYINDYCVVDLETTGIFISSARIIEISALKVRNGEVVAEYDTLINPKCRIPSAATAVNNITDEMVKDAPILDAVIDDFVEFVGDDIVIGYNNAAFDMNIIYDQVMLLKNKTFGNDYIDLMHAAKRVLPDLKNSKLQTLSEYYELDTAGEHRALKDCYLTKQCYEKVNIQFGDDAFKSKSHGSNHTIHYSMETMALQTLQSFLETIIADGKVTPNEFFNLTSWMAEHRELQGNYPFDRVFNALDRVLADGVVTSDELDELQVLFSEFVDPVKSQSCDIEISTLQNKHVCVTGNFDYGSRKEVFNLIESMGGIIDKIVKKSTDYLVVGLYGSDEWKTGKYGGKIQKAMEYNSKGTDIKIIEEDMFMSAIKESSSVDSGTSNDKEIIKTEKNQDEDWKKEITAILEMLISENELPEKSLYLGTNYSKDGKKLTSYSICIYEPDYPYDKNAVNKITKNANVLNIKKKGNDLELIMSDNQFFDIELPEDAKIKQMKDAYQHVIISINSENLMDYLRKQTEYTLANYTSKAARFGCCSKFTACSNAKKCLHENKLYSKACRYRMHLENGDIFYGKNKNISNEITKEK